MSLIPSARKALTARLSEHSADDLAMMVEWLTGCRCKSDNCHACNYMQPGGYTNPDTYLRPEKCAKYIDQAAQAAANGDGPEAKTTTPDDHAKAWRAVREACLARDRREIVGDDARHTMRLKFAVKRLGGRDAVTANLAHAEAAWGRAWDEALVELNERLAVMR